LVEAKIRDRKGRSRRERFRRDDDSLAGFRRTEGKAVGGEGELAHGGFREGVWIV